MMMWKCCTQYASKFGKLSSGHRTGKGQFSFQSQKKGNAKKCSNYHTVALISHASKVMLKILHMRLQQYVNRELPDVQTGFRKSRGTRDQIANICWITEKAREFQKSIYFCFIDYTKAFDCVDHNKLWKILKEMGIPDHLTCLQGFPGSSDGKTSAYNAEDLGSIPISGRSPGEGNGNPFQYSCLENPHGLRSLVGYSP